MDETKLHVSIIIPTKNGVNLLSTCIAKLRDTVDISFEIIVVDNASDDSYTLSYLQTLKTNNIAKVIRDDSPFNFSGLNNKAVSFVSGDVLLFLNNDIEAIHSGWLEEMLKLASLPEVGAVGAKLLYPDNRVQHAGIVMGYKGVAGHVNRLIGKNDCGYLGMACKVHEVSAVTGACLMIKKSLFLEVGGFNEKDLAVAFNDVDLCLRVRALGYKNMYTPKAVLYHHESVSRGSDLTPQNKLRFYKEQWYMYRHWLKPILSDPCYGTLGRFWIVHAILVLKSIIRVGSFIIMQLIFSQFRR